MSALADLLGELIDAAEAEAGTVVSYQWGHDAAILLGKIAGVLRTMTLSMTGAPAEYPPHVEMALDAARQVTELFSRMSTATFPQAFVVAVKTLDYAMDKVDEA